MAENSTIGWTDHTFNPWWGCTKVSEGCKHCYAETLSNRLGKNVWGPKQPRRPMSEKYWREPLQWNADAISLGERYRVFCASMADVFEGYETMPEESRPMVREARYRLFELIRQTPNLDWLVLTKRTGNVANCIHEVKCMAEGRDEDFRWWLRGLYADGLGRSSPAHNLWIGTSCEDQKTADERIPHLLNIPAVVRFVSLEPLLGPIDLIAVNPEPWIEGLGKDGKQWSDVLRGVRSLDDSVGGGEYDLDGRIDWVIVGGESGPGHRQMDTEWLHSIVSDCRAARTPIFVKQDSGHRSGLQGRINDRVWSLKQYPEVANG